MRSGANVHGLNTAGTLWCSAAIGVLSGSGLSQFGLIGTVAVLAVNAALRPLSQTISGAAAPESDAVLYSLIVTFRDGLQICVQHALFHLLEGSPFSVRAIQKTSETVDGCRIIKATLTATEPAESEMKKICIRLSLVPGVTRLLCKVGADEASMGDASGE